MKRWLTAVAALSAGAMLLSGCWGGGGNDPVDTPSPTAMTSTPSVPGATPTRNYANAIPRPGETPDPSNPESLVMWLNRDSLLPLVDTVVAGVTVGPRAERSGGPCGAATPVDIEFSEARGTRVDIAPGYLPPDAQFEFSQAVRCGNDVAFAMLTYRLPVASDLRERLAAGESYWDIPRGGSIEIVRFIGDPAENVGLPAERWEERSIAGLPAAIGHPVLDEGLGEGYVLVHADGVLTVVRTGNVSLAELLRIAHGVIENSSTSLTPVVVDAIAGWVATEQNSEHIGPCPPGDAPADTIGKWCHLPPQEAETNRIVIWVGAVASGNVWELVLEKDQGGTWTVVSAEKVRGT